MDCISSNAPGDEDLLKHVLDGEALQVASQCHLEQCEICQQRLEDWSNYSRWDTLLLKRLYRSQCPDVETLQKYCLNQVSITDIFTIPDHLKICPLCAEDVYEMKQLIKDTDLIFPTVIDLSPIEREPFDLAIQRVVAQFILPEKQLAFRGDEHNTLARNWPQRYQVNTINLTLHLSCDSNNNTLLLGILSSEDDRIDIEVFAGSKAELYRTVTGEIQAGAERALSKENDPDLMPVLKAEVDDLGNVVFHGISNGDYFIILYLPDKEIVVEDIHIEKI